MRVTVKEIEKQIEGLEINEIIEYLENMKEIYGSKTDKLLQKYLKKKNAYEKEVLRYKNMCNFEKKAYLEGKKLVAGVDEAGRGPLAGPVVAAAVILKEDEFIEGLNDSKKLSEKQREILFDIIKQRAVAYGVGIVDEKGIDDINILNATRKAMKIAVDKLEKKPDMILVDAEKINGVDIQQMGIIKGDALSVSIAAASIIAKVTRDRMISEISKVYPQYGFEKHKGYGTKQHIEAIKKYGLCPIHRVTFTKNFVK